MKKAIFCRRHLVGLNLVVLLALVASAPAATRLVPDEYPTIQSAIDDCNDGDVVIVAPGTYTGDGNRDIDFLGKAITVRSENGPESCIVDCNGTETEPHRGFYFHNGEGPDSIVAGITITGGYIPWHGWYSGGGAVSCEESSPTLTNCVFSENIVAHAGGGIFNNDSSPSVNKCIFSGNSATYGGGMWNMRNSRVSITNCAFRNNSAIGGGAIWSVSESSPMITNCTFTNNPASSRSGGAIFCGQVAFATVINCIIMGNSAVENGGALSCFEVDNFTITNCTIVENSGNALSCDSPYQKYPSNIELTNCILWNGESGIRNNDNSTIKITYTDIQGGWDGLGNIDTDPCFADPNNGDYHLLPASPCINTGDPNYVPEPNETDLDGKPRIIGGRIDMGAYEFNHRPIADAGDDLTAYAWIDGNAPVTLDGSGSYDEDGDELTYKWTWEIEGYVYEANGVSPTIELPVGEYIIELIVNDGIDDSEPNYTTVTVIEPLSCHLNILPQLINRKSHQRHVMAWLTLPAGIAKADVNDSVPLSIYPGGIEADRQYIFENRRGHRRHTSIFAFFDKAELMSAVPDNGLVRLKAVGRLRNGQYFYGCDTVRIIGSRNRK